MNVRPDTPWTEVFPTRLKLARQRCGWSQKALAANAGGGMTSYTIGLLERGTRLPDSRQLIALARALDARVGFFMSPQGVHLERIEYRKRASATVRDRARVHMSVLGRVERYLEIESLLDLDSAHWNAPCARRTLRENGDVERLVQYVRNKWDLGSGPVADVTELCEAHGLKVLSLSLPESVSGLTSLVRRHTADDVPVIVVNARHPLERRRLTVMHELAHRVIDPASTLDVERAAMRFAGAFLIPEDHLVERVGRRRSTLSAAEIIVLKRLYRVSAAAMVIRLEQIGVIRHAELARLFRGIGRRWRAEEPSPLSDDLAEKPRRFERLCHRALSEALITRSKAAELLDRPVSHFEPFQPTAVSV